jgi:hypothetical protein
LNARNQAQAAFYSKVKSHKSSELNPARLLDHPMQQVTDSATGGILGW